MHVTHPPPEIVVQAPAGQTQHEGDFETGTSHAHASPDAVQQHFLARSIPGGAPRPLPCDLGDTAGTIVDIYDTPAPMACPNSRRPSESPHRNGLRGHPET